jgi:rubrerythrin
VNEEDTLVFLDKQIDLENRIVELVELNTRDLRNAFVKDLLLGIAQDSKKHAILMGALKALVEGRVPLITEPQRDSIAKGIETHIQMETEAIRTYAELLEKSDNDAIKTVAAMIREDEVRHHKLLLDLHKALIEPETLTEEAIWESLWRDSPWHGTPGG